MSARARRPPFRSLLACTALVCAGACAAAAPSSKQGVAYRWVDEQGVVHYGDHIPPQYASQDRAILNSQGVEVGHLDAQKSQEQVAAAARERATQMKQRQHDAFLITTYTSVKDIRPYSSRADARRMPDDLAVNLVRTVNELNAQSRELAVKTEEETALRAQFQADIERYRALHTIHSQ
jgi:hypothetical protein